jgi:ubiquinone/menaquinone biosynthesis C-methylase UbiE
MTKTRVPETNTGIQGEFTVASYDQMQRHLRDKGWIETNALLKSGISGGHALEIGYGPGYLGLEWLQRCLGAHLTGLDISPDMQALARRNALEYGLADRVDYRLGHGDQLPFGDAAFDAVFTNGSLHEWEYPMETFNEVWRVLKPGGRYFISDLRRDMNSFVLMFLKAGTRPASMRSGLISSVNAAYTPPELAELARGSSLKNGKVEANPIGLNLSGEK